jgi:hypothetical protein
MPTRASELISTRSVGGDRPRRSCMSRLVTMLRQRSTTVEAIGVIADTITGAAMIGAATVDIASWLTLNVTKRRPRERGLPLHRIA